MQLNTSYHEHEIVDFTNHLLNEAMIKRASDIHFEPYQDEYRIRMRIDGVLQVVNSMPISLAKQLTVRLKIMAKLNIAEQRLPQDGQLTIEHKTMRISCLPVMYGEKIVLRVMESYQQSLSIHHIGLSQQQQNLYQQVLNSPQGLILVTGPTGSGKTVTLYSGLNEINNAEHNICSVEDPIEIPLKGINQTQVNIKVGLDFAQTLRAFLRQDPDVMMIGEIRDYETADVAIQAAQTGHLVLSTLHTNSSAEALIRLYQMGIKNYLIASSLKLIIAQRLVRKLCEHCRIPSEEHLIIKSNGHEQHHPHFIAKGCQHCLGGYHGRIGIYEFLMITPPIQALLFEHEKMSLQQIQQIMQQENMPTLFLSGLALVRQGITSLAEIYRVLGSYHSK